MFRAFWNRLQRFLRPDSEPCHTAETSNIVEHSLTGFKIILLNDGGGEFSIDEFPCTIGRRPEGCGWNREHSGLSKKHLVIGLSSNTDYPLTLEHLGTNEDTEVNHVSVKKHHPVVVRPGAKITFVGYEVKIEQCERTV